MLTPLESQNNPRESHYNPMIIPILHYFFFPHDIPFLFHQRLSNNSYFSHYLNELSQSLDVHIPMNHLKKNQVISKPDP